MGFIKATIVSETRTRSVFAALPTLRSDHDAPRLQPPRSWLRITPTTFGQLDCLAFDGLRLRLAKRARCVRLSLFPNVFELRSSLIAGLSRLTARSLYVEASGCCSQELL
jgi:hypothetical protein